MNLGTSSVESYLFFLKLFRFTFQPSLHLFLLAGPEIGISTELIFFSIFKITASLSLEFKFRYARLLLLISGPQKLLIVLRSVPKRFAKSLAVILLNFILSFNVS